MLMKIFNKGQIVIPAEIRKEFGITIGDKLNVYIDKKRKTIEIRKPTYKSKTLAGSLRKFAAKRDFPSKTEIVNALTQGLVEKHENKIN